ncbi:MAG: nitrate ABC transporter permease [Armatimonadota bacterium]
MATKPEPGVMTAPGSNRKKFNFADIFLPNRVVSQSSMLAISALWLIGILIIWAISPVKAIPKPAEVFNEFGNLWGTMGLGQDLLTSLSLNFRALVASSLICLLLSYLTVIPVFRPLVIALSKGRFLSLVGFSFVFTILIGGGETLKMILLVIGMTVFLLTSMAAVVAEIPKADFDHARTLRMSEWKVVWEVVVRGTFDQMFEVIRQNAAIGWMMLTMVEGIVRSGGGVGVMLLNEQKHMKMEAVFAIQIIILVIGLTQDYVIGALRRLVCPYASLTLERR